MKQGVRSVLRGLLWAGLLGLLAWGLAQGRTAFVTSTAGLTAAPGGAAVGSVTPGTQVTVLAERGNFSQVQVSGWSPVGGATALFAGRGQRVLLVSLTGQVQRRVRGRANDDSGGAWEQVELTAWVPKGALTASIEPVWARARALYQTRCSSCHAATATDKYTANQWPGIVRGMAPKSGLTRADQDLITRFLQAHAKQP